LALHTLKTSGVLSYEYHAAHWTKGHNPLMAKPNESCHIDFNKMKETPTAILIQKFDEANISQHVASAALN